MPARVPRVSVKAHGLAQIGVCGTRRAADRVRPTASGSSVSNPPQSFIEVCAATLPVAAVRHLIL
jgi:hypothetical protein